MKTGSYHRIFFTALCIVAAFSMGGIESANNKIEDRLKSVLFESRSGDKHLVWIYFSDKGENADNLALTPEEYLTKRSIERRLKRIKSDSYFNEKDIPVNSGYINEIEQSGIKVRHKSKWLNAVSCFADRQQIGITSQKNFVDRIDLVNKYSVQKDFEGLNEPVEYSFNESDNPQSINYGPSYNQSGLINVPPVHDLGYTGEGILIANFDAGFDNLQHPCFDLLRSRGLRTYDFVNGDTIVANGPGRAGQGFHGTYTLSLVGGYDPGHLVSPAFDATYILAKTENTDSETPLEEDNWVAAAEWADSLGADIITSSLGYLLFNPPYKSYSWESMDGNTAVITRAADIAVSKGIIVVTSAGNEGYHPSHNTLSAPADGDSVITVGAVLLNKSRWANSSIGPTVDGRIKPEVMALGVNNYYAKSGSGSLGYSNSQSGTSLACPMVAGVCALLLNANPNLSPIDVRNVLTIAADSSLHPNSLRGWGIINSLASIQRALNLNLPSDFELLQNFPNPFNPSTRIQFNLKRNAAISLIIYDVSGRELIRLIDNQFIQIGNREVQFFNTGLSSGVYIYSLVANGEYVDSKKMIIVK